MDGKAGKLFSGLGGSFCDLCLASKEDAHDIEHVSEGFKINCTISDTKAIWDMLVDADGMEIQKAPKDYEIRKVVTTKPIQQVNAPIFSVLHTVLRNFDVWAHIYLQQFHAGQY